jgi:hemolysin activation/secretion protein
MKSVVAGRRLGPALGLSVAVAGALPVAAALAQSTSIPFPGQAQPGRNIQAPSPPATPQFDFSIPSPQRGPVPRAVDVIEFDVTDITVVGATKFPPAAFKPLTDPLAGKKAKLSDIIDVADKIEAMYRAHGYVLTRAFVPPQTVSQGHFKINVVEGFVKATAVSGGDDMTRDRVEAYLQPVTQEKPATLGTMERGLLLANDLPGTVASGVLRPSPTEPGASDLIVNLNEPPWEATLYSDNRGAAATGVYTVGAQLVANTLYYVPGQILLDVSGTPDFSQRRLLQGHYTRPVGYNGVILTLTGVDAHGVPVALGGNLVSDSFALGARLSYPWVVSRALKVSVEGGLTVQGAKVTAATTPAGAPTGTFPIYNDDQWRDLDVAVTTEYRGLYRDSNTGATVGITQGVPILGAQSTNPFVPPGSTTPTGASTGFTKYTLVATHDQPISGPVSANVHGLGQWTDERLVIGEQTSFGGSGIGRGYDPAALAGDIGYGLAGELRYDTHFPQYHLDSVQFYTFYDFAQVRPVHDESPPPVGLATHRTLMSTGVGVRAALMERVTGDIELAQELRGVPNNDSDKRDTRILFNGAIRF